MEKKKKKRTLRREIIEWSIIIGTGAILYFTGLHTQVIGTIQGLVLETGLMRPETSKEEFVAEADYNFRLMDADGKTIEGSELKGKTIFMNFWATWCPPCIAEMPDIHDLYRKLKDDDNIEFIMVSVNEDFSKARQFIEKKEFDFNIYRFTSGVPRIYSSQAIPTTFVISPEGKIVVKREGIAKYDTRSFRNFLVDLGK